MSQESISRPSTPPTRTSSSARASLTLDHVWLAAALILLALRPLFSPIPPHDFWWHMATGRLIVNTGAIPTVDGFSYTQFGQPFFNQSWLAEVLMYGLYWLGGIELIVLAQSLIIVLAYGLLLRLCLVASGSIRLSVVLILVVMLVSFSNWSVRPQSYTFPLFAAFVMILANYRAGRSNRLWLLPLLMVLWVNMHGAFVLGLALIGITFVGELLKRVVRGATTAPPAALLPLVIWGALSGLATLINPRGVGVLGYVRSLLGSSAVTTLVTEWAPPTIRDADGSGAIFFIFVMGCVAVLAYVRQRPDLTDMLLFGAFFWLALGASRNIVWIGFVVAPLLATQLASALPKASTKRRPSGSPMLNGVLIGVLGLLVLLCLPWIKPHLGLPASVGGLLSEDTPVAAVEALRAQNARPQRLFHTEAYGSYLIWAAPEQPVFIDTRIELYPYEQWNDYIMLSQGLQVEQLLQKYGFDGFLLNKERQNGLIEHLKAMPGWITQFEDEQTIYLSR